MKKNPLHGRTALIRRAVRLQWFTIFWMVFEGAVAVCSGLAAHSLSLIAFGADSFIELISAGVLLWRLKVEADRGEEFSESADQFARKVAGILLVCGELLFLGKSIIRHTHIWTAPERKTVCEVR